MKSSEKIDKLCEAMVKAQAELKAPPLDSTNPHFRNRYASLAAVRDAIVPVFNRHALYVLQAPGSNEKGPTLTTVILHTSGQWLELEPLALPVQRQDAQGYGSATTYARRYALLSIAGVVAEEDDDGHEASRPARKAEAPARPLATPPQKEALGALKEQLKMSDRGFVNMMEAEFQCSQRSELTQEQAEKFLTMLRRQLPAVQQDLARTGSAGTGPCTAERGGR